VKLKPRVVGAEVGVLLGFGVKVGMGVGRGVTVGWDVLPDKSRLASK
jgi:hypothetical protein